MVSQQSHVTGGRVPAGVPTTTPLVTVVIPTYNHARYVVEAIESVLAQTYRHWEIVVIDDGSTDDTADVIRRYPDVRYIYQANRGLPGARNRGLQEARGEYVVFLDADDRLLPRHLEANVAAFALRPDAGWVAGDFRFLGEDPTWHHVHRCEFRPDCYASLLRVNFIVMPGAVMYKREVVADIGGFDERLRSAEDYDLYFRLARKAPFYCHHEVIAEYRRVEGQMSQQWVKMLRWQMRVLRAQRRVIRGQAVYEEAYREGLARCRDRYGEQALWQTVAMARQGRWRTVGRALPTLLVYYPQGVAGLLRAKMKKYWLQVRGHGAV